MDFMTAVKTCFSKYVTFSGRARRSEYWWWVLFVWVVSMGLSIVDSVLFGNVVTGPGSFYASTDNAILSGIFSLVVFLPGLAVAVRRLHDTDRSGWWLLIVLIPLVGWILLIVWFATEGTEGENRFGPDPLGRRGYDDGFDDGVDYARSRVPRVPRD